MGNLACQMDSIGSTPAEMLEMCERLGTMRICSKMYTKFSCRSNDYYFFPLNLKSQRIDGNEKGFHRYCSLDSRNGLLGTSSADTRKHIYGVV